MSATPSSADVRTVSPLDCEHAVRRLWDYLDGRLPDVARDEVEKHLATCEGCPPRFAFAEKMHRALRESAARERAFGPAGAAESRLRARVREALWGQNVPGANGPAASSPDAARD